MRILSVSCLRDEGPFLLEWLAWHRLLGVTDFLVYSNDCTDGSDVMLDHLARQGVVEHIRNTPAPKKSIQWSALKAAWQHPLRKSSDWMLISDFDEFPMIHAGEHRFADLFAALPDHAEAITLPWRLFGHSGIVNYHDSPVTQQFVFSAPPDMLHPIASNSIKTLFRPSAFKKPGVHRPAEQKNRPSPTAPRTWFDGSGSPLDLAFAMNDNRLSLAFHTDYRSLVEMHHYSLKSAQSYLYKSQRGLPNRREKQIDLSYWVERNFNTVPNHAALALQEPLAAEIAKLKSLPHIQDLHNQACAHHRATIAKYLLDWPGYKLFKDCLHCANTTVLPRKLEMHLLELFHQLNTQSD